MEWSEMPYKDPEKERQYKKEWYLKLKKNPVKYKRRIKSNRDYVNKKKALVKAHKSERGCIFCGEKRPSKLHLHHMNPNAKIMSVSDMTKWYGYAKLNAEIKKCVVMCSKHHKEYHIKNGFKPVGQ